jgi:hypothetical protein
LNYADCEIGIPFKVNAADNNIGKGKSIKAAPKELPLLILTVSGRNGTGCPGKKF